jgi:hypothetical protein
MGNHLPPIDGDHLHRKSTDNGLLYLKTLSSACFKIVLVNTDKTIKRKYSAKIVVSVDGRKMISHGQNMRVGILHVHLLDSAKEKVLLMQYRKAEIQSLMNL